MAEPHPSKPSPRQRLFTVGYEGRPVTELVMLLRTHGVQTLVDVRLNAVSCRRGYSKNALITVLQEAGIEYIHERELGNPVDNRAAYRNGSRQAHERYRSRVRKHGQGAIDRVTERAKASRVALLCFEREADRCHRTAVAAATGLRAVAL